MLEKKKISSKINYDVLRDLNSKKGEAGSEGGGSSPGRSPSDRGSTSATSKRLSRRRRKKAEASGQSFAASASVIGKRYVGQSEWPTHTQCTITTYWLSCIPGSAFSSPTPPRKRRRCPSRLAPVGHWQIDTWLSGDITVTAWTNTVLLCYSLGRRHNGHHDDRNSRRMDA